MVTLQQTFPVGVHTAVYNWGTALLALGNEQDVNAELSIKPVFGDPTSVNTPKFILWSDGDPFLPFTQTISGISGSFTVPVVDQAGWVSPNGNAITNWHYQVTIRYQLNNESVEITRDLYPMDGQEAQDLDVIVQPGDSDPVIVITAAVRSVSYNGGAPILPDENGNVDLGTLSVGGGGGGGPAVDSTARQAAADAMTEAQAAYSAASDAGTAASNAQTAANGKYTKPSAGIPKADLAADAKIVTAPVDTRIQNTDGTYPSVGTAPAGQLLMYIGNTAPDPSATREPSIWLRSS